MKRGELYRVANPSKSDPKRSRVFVVVGRSAAIESRLSTVICAPASQVEVGVEEGLKHSSSIHCDELVSLSKSALTDFVATLSPAKLDQLDRALAIALEIRAEKS
ncbi:MAG TPA: type II toxin-antitoxin system PemK/MazF family toxin [Thermoanaerobaculia bacterium]